jgi:hypothetical protein
LYYIPLHRRVFYYYYSIEELRFIVGVNVECSRKGEEVGVYNYGVMAAPPWGYFKRRNSCEFIFALGY